MSLPPFRQDNSILHKHDNKEELEQDLSGTSSVFNGIVVVCIVKLVSLGNGKYRREFSHPLHKPSVYMSVRFGTEFLSIPRRKNIAKPTVVLPVNIVNYLTIMLE